MAEPLTPEEWAEALRQSRQTIAYWDNHGWIRKPREYVLARALRASEARERELREAEYGARAQERIGNEGDADAIRRDAIRSFLGLKPGEPLAALGQEAGAKLPSMEDYPDAV